MKIWILFLSGSWAQTDCGDIHQEWYGTTCADAMTCSGTFACVVPQTCNAYQCVQDGWCPDGEFYLPYFPANSSDQAGWACFPPDRVRPPSFDCDFGDGPNFALFVNAKVPPISKQPGHQDDRNVTLISRDAYDQERANDGPVEVFDDSECHGTIDGKGCFIPNFYIFSTEKNQLVTKILIY